MKLPDDRIIDLISRLRGGLNAAEMAELEAWKNASEENRKFAEQFNEEEYIAKRLKERQEIDVEAGLKKFFELAGLDRKPVIPLYKRRAWLYLAAACVMGVLVTSGYFLYTTNKKPQGQGEGAYASKDVLPGSDKAILYLADNTTVLLDTVSGTTIAQQGNSRILKTGEGSITYANNKTGSVSQEITYNRLVTPRAAQYNLILPDGSRVWLNASSSIKYPTSFAGNERRVEISGEAYFEVTKNPAMPFRVQFDKGQIEVLGTHFNVNTYGDENDVQALLLEGAVKITNTSVATSPALQSLILKPGQQAAFNAGEKISLNKEADIDQVMAWKEGYFSFDNTSLRLILKQMSRWYDLDVDYELSDDPRFSFKMNRTVNISKLIKILQKTSAIKFEINGKTIKVTKGQD